MKHSIHHFALITKDGEIIRWKGDNFILHIGNFFRDVRCLFICVGNCEDNFKIFLFGNCSSFCGVSVMSCGLSVCYFQIFYKQTMFLLINMGGRLKRLEPKICKEIHKNEEVWDLLSRTGMKHFVFSMKGYNRGLSLRFCNSQ